MTRKEYRNLTAWYNRKAKIAADMLISRLKFKSFTTESQCKEAFNIAEKCWNKLKDECIARGLSPIIDVETTEVTDLDGYNHMVFCPLVIGFRKAQENIQ